MAARPSAVVLAVLAVALVSSDARAQSFGAAPFEAWVVADDLTVVPSRDQLWPGLGIVRYGEAHLPMDEALTRGLADENAVVQIGVLRVLRVAGRMARLHVIVAGTSAVSANIEA